MKKKKENTHSFKKKRTCSRKNYLAQESDQENDQEKKKVFVFFFSFINSQPRSDDAEPYAAGVSDGT